MKRPEPNGFKISPTEYEIVFNFNNISDHWSNLKIFPYGSYESYFSPRATAINYAEGIIEGLKAHLDRKEKNAIILHLENNAKRFAQSAAGMYMPPFPEEKFIEAIKELIRKNSKFIPPYKKGALYIRPIEGGEDNLGVKGSPGEYKYPYKTIFWCSPVGVYAGKPPICNITYKVRATRGGTGAYKASCNYVAAKLALRKAAAQGCDEVLFLELDSATENYRIQEFSVMSAFMVKNGVLYTPSLDNETILPGLTREMVIKIAKAINIPVNIENIDPENLMDADEVFGTGTAANITPIAGFVIDRVNHLFPINEKNVGPITQKLSGIIECLQVNELPEEYQNNENLIKLQKEITTIIPL